MTKISAAKVSMCPILALVCDAHEHRSQPVYARANGMLPPRLLPHCLLLCPLGIEIFQVTDVAPIPDSPDCSETSSACSIDQSEDLVLLGAKRSLESEGESIDPKSSQCNVLGSRILSHWQDEANTSNGRTPASHRRRTVGMFARIPKQDIRRAIPFMFANVLNSCDPALIRSFFQQLCAPGCRSTDYNHVPWSVNDKIVVSHVNGSTATGDRFAIGVSRYPDFAMSVTGSQIVRRKNFPGCTVLIQFQFKGTRVRGPMACVTTVDNETHLMPAWVFHSIHASGHAVNGKVASHEIIQQPLVKVGMRGSICITLDSFNCISRIFIDQLSITMEEGEAAINHRPPTRTQRELKTQ